MTDAAAQTLGLDYCPGDKVQCGHQETPEGEIPMYCFQSGQVTFTTVPPAGTPDLVIQDVWYYGDIEGVYTEIRYDIKNRGDGPAGPSTTALYIDGVKVAEDSVATLTAGEHRIRQVSYSATCSGDGDTFAADADFYHSVAESDETNNHRERTYPCPSAISIPDFYLAEVWHEGEEVYYYDYRDYTATEPISFRVENIGDASTPSATARLYVDGVWSSSRSVPALAPGDEYSGYFSYIGSCSAGQDTIRVVIDEEAMVTEFDETNNEKTVTWLSYVEPPTAELPDLVIEHISVTEEETDSVTFPNGTVVTYPSMWRVSYRIRNTGAGYSPSSETGLFIDGVNHGRDYVPPLAPGESSDEEFMGLYPTSFCTGTHDSFTVMADYESLVAESNNINNQMPYTFTCIEIPTTPVLAPDLNVTGAWYEPSGGIENLRIYYTVRNIGDAAAGPSTTRIYIGYSEFATDRVPGLAAGAEVTRSFTTLWTPLWDTSHIEIALDRGNEVSETTAENPGEMNNIYRTDWIFAPSCSDGVRNRDETGVDCGGYYCRPCSYCDDGIRNGDETGVDCGGTYCPPCSPCSTSAIWAPTDGVCTTCWPTSEGPTIGMNTNDDSCAIVEVCDPNLDYIVADAITCAEHPDFATRYTGANAAEKVCACTNARAGSGIDVNFNAVTYRKTLGMYAIYALGSCHAYMQGYFYGEWCCYGSDGICGDNTDCGYWSVLPAAWDMGTAASCSHRPEPTPDFMMGGHRCVHKSFLWWDWGKPGYWSSDTNFRSNSDSVCDVPAHASINRLSTGTCVDYSFALTTLLRKMGYSRSDVYSVNGEGHGYNLVRFPGETKWHYVDTTGNRGAEITGGTGYDAPTNGYDYCRKMDDGCSNDYWSQSTGNCPANSNIFGCEGV